MPTYFDLQNSPVLTTPSALTAPKITSIGYPGDDTAADTAGGQTITITGAGFESGATVLINTTAVGVVTVVSSTTITFTSPANSAGSYVLYVVNTDGGTAIAVPGIQYSGVPTWTTAAGSLGSYTETVAIANTVTATGDAPVTYSVFSGSLPTGATLNSANGYISGTSPLTASPTTYTFTIRATDGQQQDTNRSFSLTINPDVVTWSSPANGTTYTSFANSAISNVALSASAASGQGIVYTANALPTGLSISGSNITGTPTVVANSSTLLTATANTTNATATRTINWVISLANDTYFPYVTSLLSASTPTSTFVSDASTNNFAVSVFGDTRPSNFGPYTPGYYSNFFDGTGDYLTVADNVALQMTGDFTWEAWVYPFSLPGAGNFKTFWAQRANDAGFGGPAVVLDSAGNMLLFVSNATATAWAVGSFDTGLDVSTNQWQHIALVKNGTTLTLYKNGVAGTSTTHSTAVGTSSSLSLMAGAANGIQAVDGYMSNFRIVKGTAVYTSNFTPSTTPLTAIANTSLLTCQSNRFIDNSTNNFTITRNGDTAVSGFDPFLPDSNFAGRGSGYFDGTGDYLNVPGNSAFEFGTGNMTMEAYVYRTVSGTVDTILQYGRASVSNYDGISWALYISSSNYAGFEMSDGGSAAIITLTSSVLFPTNAWTHLALVRSGNNFTLYQNGVSVATGSTSASFYIPSSSLFWVARNHNAGTGDTAGYISDVRIVKGTAVYTSAFTPPTAPLTAIANTSLLTLQNNQPNNNSMFLDSSTNNFNVTRNGNTTQGTFSPYGGGWSNYFNGSTDYFSMSDNNAFQYGAGDFALECWVYPPATPATYSYIVSQWYTGDKGIIFGNVNGYPAFLYSTTGSNDLSVTSSTVFPVNQWSHLMACRTGNTISLYLNGTRVATTTESGTLYNSTSSIGIATHVQGLGSYLWSGYISNLRSIAGSSPYNAAQTTITVPTAPLTAVANTRLLICADNRFIDDGPSNFTLTRAGTPSVQRFNPFNPVLTTPTSYSGFFDGTGDYLSLSANSAFDITSGDFTVEMWVYRTTNGAEQYLWSNRADNPARGWEWRINSTNLMQFFFTGGSSLTSTGTVPTNTWTHLAVSRQTNTVRFFINGALDSSTAFSNGTAVTTSLFLGYSTSGGGYLTGYMSNARLVKGTAVYTAAFTPSTTPLTAIANTSLLTLQSATFIDNSTNNFAITNNGDTAPRQFNPFGWTSTTGSSAAYTPALYGGSAYFDGASDYLSIADNAALEVGSGSFTLECWFYITGSNPANGANILSKSNSSSFGPYAIGFNPSGQFQALSSTSGSSWEISLAPSGISFSSLAGRWNHVAYVRNGTSFVLYLNGVSVASATSSGTLVDNTNAFMVGYINFASTEFPGYISDVRLTKGQARYTSNFQPPIAPLTAQQNTVLLNNMTGAGIYDSAMMTDYETLGNASISTSLKKYGNTSMYFDGTGDYLKAPYIPQYSLPGDFTVETWVYLTSAAGAGNQTLVSYQYINSNDTGIWGFYLNGTGPYTLYFNTQGVPHASTTTTSIPINTWTHVAYSRTGSTGRFFVNGTQLGSNVTDTSTYSGTSGSLFVGMMADGSSAPLYGYLDDLRITRGVARYTANFTPPTTPFITN